MPSIQPFLWYNKEAEEAANFYAGLLPNSKVGHISALPVDTPSGPAGSVKVVEFALVGQPFMAMSAGPLDPFNHAISLMVIVDTQAEIDRLWEGLSEGGKKVECGWLQDKYGLYWQIVPAIHFEMMKDKDPAKVKRVTEAMLKMTKFVIADLQKAYDGK